MKYFFVPVFILFNLFSLTGQTRTIHVLVALCDNKYQGIVPVPAGIGNGQDPANNLYWGCGNGVKTFFKKQSDWIFIKQINKPAENIYERLIFKNKNSKTYLVADAYNGQFIKQTTTDLLDYSAGLKKSVLTIDSLKLNIGGAANLLCYIGHDGLMDFQLETTPKKSDNAQREVIILACYSKSFFKDAIQKSGASPLLWSTHLMCPEAYTLHAALAGWVLNETPEKVKERAAQAYNQYLKCGIKGARNLLVTGY